MFTNEGAHHSKGILGSMEVYRFHKYSIYVLAPDDPPQHLQVQPYTETSVKVTWVAPPDYTWNGDLDGFIIEHRLYLSMSDHIVTLIPDPAANTYIIENLVCFNIEHVCFTIDVGIKLFLV